MRVEVVFLVLSFTARFRWLTWTLSCCAKPEGDRRLTCGWPSSMGNCRSSNSRNNVEIRCEALICCWSKFVDGCIFMAKCISTREKPLLVTVTVPLKFSSCLELSVFCDLALLKSSTSVKRTIVLMECLCTYVYYKIQVQRKAKGVATTNHFQSKTYEIQIIRRRKGWYAIFRLSQILG